MSFNICTMVAAEHRAQLVRDADAWRRRRQARQAAKAAKAERAAARITPPAAYCRRAAAQALRGAT